MINVAENGRIQILDESICFSLHVDGLGKGMHPSLLPGTAMATVEGQTVLKPWKDNRSGRRKD